MIDIISLIHFSGDEDVVLRNQPYKILYGWVGEPAVSIHMALSSNPSFSRAGRADIQTVWEPHRSCTDTLPLDYDRCAKEKIRKKEGCVALQHEVL